MKTFVVSQNTNKLEVLKWFRQKRKEHSPGNECVYFQGLSLILYKAICYWRLVLVLISITFDRIKECVLSFESLFRTDKS